MGATENPEEEMAGQEGGFGEAGDSPIVECSSPKVTVERPQPTSGVEMSASHAQGTTVTTPVEKSLSSPFPRTSSAVPSVGKDKDSQATLIAMEMGDSSNPSLKRKTRQEESDCGSPVIQPRANLEKKKEARKNTETGPLGQGAQWGPEEGCNLGRENTTGEPAGVILQPDGFYDVRVNYTHCLGLADRCGLNPEDVIETMDEDNEDRRTGLKKKKEAEELAGLFAGPTQEGENSGLNMDEQ